MKAARHRSILAAALTLTCAMATVGVALPAYGANTVDKTALVQGTQTDNGDGTLQMHSNKGHTGLVGNWQTTTIVKFKFVDPLLTVSGTERFDGCLDTNGDNACRDEPTGQLTFDFSAWSRWDTTVVPAREIAGACVHPVTGGSGAFTGARGLLTMRDFLAGGVLRTTYRGILTSSAPGDAATSRQLSADNSPMAAEAAPAVAATVGAAPPMAVKGC